MDRGEIFLHPVNQAEVPDYFDVITKPMCWLFIDEKLEKNEYLNVTDFKVISESAARIMLILTSAIFTSFSAMQCCTIKVTVPSTESPNVFR